MAAPVTTGEFLDVVRKSGVVEEARLSAYLLRLTESGEQSDQPKPFAASMVRDGLLSHFQADQLVQGKWKRFFIGKYKVLERIGSGGMGQVFLCEHKLMRRRVAVKVLPLAKSNDPASLERFYREARAVAALDHSNIVRAYDIDQDDNLHFLVMEFVDGTNLQELVKTSGLLDVQRASHYIYGALVGLQHAHEMGLVHRDMKPANILVDRSGVVKVLDMGLARFFHDETDQLTRKYDENVLGTADYLAPEQAVDSHTVDIRADIYALGATFYFLLTGNPPFPEGTVADKLNWHQTREPAPIRRQRPDVPVELAAIISKMMAKIPAKRYSVPADVLRELSPWVQTPIAPPSDLELPTLSLAAMGTGGPMTSRVAAGSHAMMGTPPGVAFATPTSGIPNDHLQNGLQTKSASTTVTTVAATTPAPALYGAMPIPVLPVTKNSAPVHAASVSLVNIWGDVVAQKQQPIVQKPSKAPSPFEVSPFAQAPVEAVQPAHNKWRLYLLIGVAAMTSFVLVVGGGLYFLLSKTRDGQTQSAADGKKWYVTKSGTSPNANRTKTTLREALDQAVADDTVVLLDDTLDEAPVKLSDAGKGLKRGIKIEAGNAAKLVTWTPRASGPRSGPALEISYVENLTIRGLVIDLNDVGECGIAVGFTCPGLTIENVTVKNPRVSGFRFQGVTGETTRPIRLADCRVVTTTKFDAGLLLTSGNRNLVIANNRFEGPGEAAIKIEGAVHETEIRNNRFFDFDTGIWFTGKLPTDLPFSLTVTNNTFHTISSAGLQIDLAINGAKHQLVVAKNFFANTKEIAKSITATVPALKATDNAHDTTTKEGKLRVNAIAIPGYEMTTTNPTLGPSFLQPDGTRLANIGPNKVTVGYRPE